MAAYGAKGPLVLGVTWTEAALALILVGLRAKTASLCPPGRVSSGIFGLRWDCFWVIIALTLALCAQSFMTVSAVYGLGNHQSVLPPSDIVKTNLWSWIAQIVAILCLAVARIAVISFLLSLQERTHQKGRWLLYIVGALQGIINVVEVVLILKQCAPIQKLWNPSVQGTCDFIKICSQVGFLQGSIGAAADLILAFYPVYIIGRLQKMKWSLKIGLCLIMGGGLIAGIAGINKTIAISSITQTQDLTYAIYTLNTWVLTEMWFIIIFGSIPVLRPLFVRFAQNVKTAAGHSGERTNHPTYVTTSGKPNDTWVQLEGRNHTWATHDSAHSKMSYTSRHEAFSGAHSSNRNRGPPTKHLNTGSRVPKSWERSESEEHIVDVDDASAKQPWAVGQAIGSTEADVEVGSVDASKEAGKIVKTVQIEQYYT